ncbi:MAG: hypothetical protein NT126_05760 [Bacteroidetes bacterium]|nr:hypothetical protein [Bacteroidota bacterium]
MKKIILASFLFLMAVSSCMGISVYLLTLDAACNQNNGSITAYVNGGTPPYTAVWSNGDTTLSIQNLSPGNYTLTVYDATGDSLIIAGNIGSGALNNIIIAIPLTVFACHGQCNGMFQINPSYLNGTPPYNFTSDHGVVVPDWPVTGWTTIGQLCDGDNVTVSVTDGAGCTGQQTQAMVAPAVLNPIITISPSCDSLSNGAVTVDSVASWFFGVNMAITTTTSFNTIPDTWQPGIVSLSPSVPFTTNNLPPGNYYFGISYQYTDYQNPYYGCTEYIPFTVPDLGTNCGTVQGDVFVDLNSDCVEDVTDIAMPNMIMEFTPGPYYAYTNSTGHYAANLPWGNYNLTQNLSGSFSQICPANPYPATLSSGNSSITVNFADSSLIPFDITASISHGTARPGFNFSYGMLIRNLSYDTSGVVTVTLDRDTLLSFVSANPVPLSVSATQVVWQINQLTSFETVYLTAAFSVPANPALIGDTLMSSVNVQATTSEINLSNNTASTFHRITGSYDPNIKYVEPEGSFFPGTNSPLTYTIEFQNTGNDTAFNIEVIDTLDANLDVNTFIPLASSFPYTVEIAGHGVIHFHFNSIHLPDSVADEPNSHGFVSFSIHPKANLLDGTMISNTAHIVFDSNPPVVTNTTISTVDFTLAALSSPITGDLISVFPNPTTGIIHVKLKNDRAAKNIFICDVLGNMVFEKNDIKGSNLDFNFSGLSKGV